LGGVASQGGKLGYGDSKAIGRRLVRLEGESKGLGKWEVLVGLKKKTTEISARARERWLVARSGS